VPWFIEAWKSVVSIGAMIGASSLSSSIHKHLEKYRILTDAQHGFRKKRSCEFQLVLTVQDLAKSMDLSEQIDQDCPSTDYVSLGNLGSTKGLIHRYHSTVLYRVVSHVWPYQMLLRNQAE
jgi:hypothetical protein